MLRITQYSISVLICFVILQINTAVSEAADGILIQNVTLIDGTGRPPSENAYVLVNGDRLAVISDTKIVPPVGTRIIDGTGKFLIPGLIDSHIHLPGGRTGPGNRQMIMDPESGIKILHGFLYAGVTAVYDSGNHAAYIHKMRADERAGRILSPRIFATISLIAPPNGHGCCAGGTVVTNYEDGIEKLNALFKLEPDLLKFTRERRGMGPVGRNMPLIDTNTMNRLMIYAHENGIRTTVHVSEQALAREAIEAGADAFAHTIYLDDADPDFATLVATNNVVVCSTIIRQEADLSFLDDPLFAALITPEEVAAAMRNERFSGGPFTQWLKSLRPAILNNIRQLFEAGVVISAGTDRTIGAMIHQEIQLLNEAGLPPLEALKAATLNAAIYIGVEDEIGSIEVGKLADMILLTKDPSVSIANTKSIESVFKGGREIERSKLDVPINRG